jgi:hypothetical protein
MVMGTNMIYTMNSDGGGVSYVTFDPTQIGPNTTLTNGNLTLTSTASGSSCPSTLARSSGKYCLKITVDNYHTPDGISLGFSEGNSWQLATVGFFPGVNNWGLLISDHGHGKAFNTTYTSGYGANAHTGMIIIPYVDFDAGTMGMIIDGTDYGIMFSFTPNTLLWFHAHMPNSSCTANYGATIFTGGPSGYWSWDHNQFF